MAVIINGKVYYNGNYVATVEEMETRVIKIS